MESDESLFAKPKRGRPKRAEKLKVVYLKDTTINMWTQQKEQMGFKSITNSDFAEILLARPTGSGTDLTAFETFDDVRPRKYGIQTYILII